MHPSPLPGALGNWCIHCSKALDATHQRILGTLDPIQCCGWWPCHWIELDACHLCNPILTSSHVVSCKESMIECQLLIAATCKHVKGWEKSWWTWTTLASWLPFCNIGWPYQRWDSLVASSIACPTCQVGTKTSHRFLKIIHKWDQNHPVGCKVLSLHHTSIYIIYHYITCLSKKLVGVE